MDKSHYLHLSKRECQIMDVVYKLGQASAFDIEKHLADPPSYHSIRVTLGILEKKGYLTHRREGQRYIFSPTDSAETAQNSILEHVLSTFFKGSAQNIVSAVLNMQASKMSDKELDKLTDMIEKAKRENAK